MTIRKHIQRNRLGVLPQTGLFLQLKRRRHPPQPVHLVQHLRPRHLSRPPKALIHPTQILRQRRQFRLHALPTAASFRFAAMGIARAPSRCASSSAVVIASGNWTSSCIHHRGNRRLQQRRAQPRQHWRNPSQNRLIQHRTLRKVGNLRRPANISRRRQNRILKHRPQQRIRTQSAPAPSPESQATPQSNRPVHPPSTEHPHCRAPQTPPAPPSPHPSETTSTRPRRHQHLRMIPGLHQFLVPRQSTPPAIPPHARSHTAAYSRPAHEIRVKPHPSPPDPDPQISAPSTAQTPAPASAAPRRSQPDNTPAATHSPAQTPVIHSPDPVRPPTPAPALPHPPAPHRPTFNPIRSVSTEVFVRNETWSTSSRS